MHCNLLEEHWIPVIRKDGSRGAIAPWEITEGDPLPVDLAPPRPDFRAALLEFLVGLMQTALAPAKEKDWRRLLQKPPKPEELREALALHAPFFNLFGSKPLFMQDFDLEPPEDTKDANEVAALLIDSPGGQTLRNNGDFFVKRGAVTALCPTCAAMALFTLQDFAPAGGKGNRTSLRGGGPLSTLVDGTTLWDKLWRNVVPLSATHARLGSVPRDAELAGGVYPWAAPTRRSEKGEQTHPTDVHPLQAFWGMPRRILLLPEENPDGESACSLCSARTPRLVRRYLSRPYGTNYGDTWRHPLTPYRDQGQDKTTLSVKGSASISGYGHWLGIVYGQGSDVGIRRAACVEHALEADEAMDSPAQVCVAGYDMDNMKPLQWCESRFPYLRVQADLLPEFRTLVDMLVSATEAVRRNLVGQLKEALVNEAGRNQAKTDKTLFENAGAALWGRTEAEFYRLAGELVHAPDFQACEPLRMEWGRLLVRTARDLFEEQTQRGRVKPERMQRIVEAGRKLDNFNRKKMLTDLALPQDQGAN
ncbi:type I-E CRISPR-associated protein Cse1/CasA [Desulfocurvus sp. DL9XJH121]